MKVSIFNFFIQVPQDSSTRPATTLARARILNPQFSIGRRPNSILNPQSSIFNRPQAGLNLQSSIFNRPQAGLNLQSAAGLVIGTDLKKETAPLP